MIFASFNNINSVFLLHLKLPWVKLHTTNCEKLKVGFNMYVIDDGKIMSESPKIICLHVQEKCFRRLLVCGCLEPLISMFYMYGF
jgi:hypothetical protein